MKRLSSRFHLALGLSSIVVTLLLGALFIGLVPDRDGALRAGRASLAETVAVGATVLLDDEDDQRLEQMLGFIVRRDPKLLTIALRQADGTLRLAVGQPPPPHVANAASTETHVRVPLVRDGAAWGQAELVFAPLHGEGLVAEWIESPAALIGAMGAACFGFFYFYLRRMLRHLDPSSVIPGRVRTAFDTLAEGLLVLDPKGRIVLANRAFMDVVGGDADKLVGQPVASLAWRALPDADAEAEASADPWAAIVAEGQARRNVLMHLVDQHGRRRSFMVNGSPVPGAGGRAAGMLVSLDDVTALEEQELQLRLARDQAEAANRAKSDFLANMSHEIRTPMNAILGFAELLRRGWQQDSRDAQRHLDTILGSGRHLLALINDILDLSKVEAGRLEVDRIPCPVHEIVQEVAAILRVRAEEKGLALVVEFPQAMPATMLTDPPRLRQIVTNLVGNAIKFTATGAHHAERAGAARRGAGAAGDRRDRHRRWASRPTGWRRSSTPSCRPRPRHRATSAAPAWAWRSAGASHARSAATSWPPACRGRAAPSTSRSTPASSTTCTGSRPSSCRPRTGARPSKTRRAGSSARNACWWSTTAPKTASWYGWCWRTPGSSSSRRRTAPSRSSVWPPMHPTSC